MYGERSGGRIKQLEDICRSCARQLRARLVRVAFVVVIFDDEHGDRMVVHATNAGRVRVAKALRAILERIERESD